MRSIARLSRLILIAALASGSALAKLPPPDEAAQAKAAEARAKAAAQTEAQAQALERAQDRVVERYRREKGIVEPAPAAPQ